MSSSKLLSLSDFEWASTARYIVYVSNIANLREINSNHVISFPLGRLGPEKLLKQKEAVLILLEENKASIERFVGKHRDELDENEMAVLRTLYLQYKSNAESVKGHIDIIASCMIEIELGIAQAQEVDSDDALF